MQTNTIDNKVDALEVSKLLKSEDDETIHTHKVVFYRAKRYLGFLWKWKIVAKNSNIIATSSQGYIRRDSCEYNAKSTGASLIMHFGGVPLLPFAEVQEL